MLVLRDVTIYSRFRVTDFVRITYVFITNIITLAMFYFLIITRC